MMYSLRFNKGTFSEIVKTKAFDASFKEKIETLSLNPKKGAAKTGIPLLTEYYVNCSRHCILFDIIEKEKLVVIYKVYHSSRLYRIMSGKALASK